VSSRTHLGSCPEPCRPGLWGSRVHVVDDDPHFRTGLGLLLESAGLCVEYYQSAEHFLSTFRRRPPECLLLDLRMTGISGLELQQEMTQRRIDAPVIVVSAFAQTASVVQAVQNGALDFLEKPIEEDRLLEKVRTALARDAEQAVTRDQLSACLGRLTDREREVMDHLIAAKTTREAARDLGISPKTVEKHRIHIFEKLGVDSVPGLIRKVLR
jgi:two-component system response regulator FixJ